MPYSRNWLTDHGQMHYRQCFAIQPLHKWRKTSRFFHQYHITSFIGFSYFGKGHICIHVWIMFGKSTCNVLGKSFHALIPLLVFFLLYFWWNSPVFLSSDLYSVSESIDAYRCLLIHNRMRKKNGFGVIVWPTFNSESAGVCKWFFFVGYGLLLNCRVIQMPHARVYFIF